MTIRFKYPKPWLARFIEKTAPTLKRLGFVVVFSYDRRTDGTGTNYIKKITLKWLT